MAIAKIKHKGLRELFVNGKTSRVGVNFHQSAIDILDHLDAVVDLADCEGVKDFHPLKGDRKDQYSMHVNGNWCIVFTYDGTDFTVLDFTDYH